MVCGHPPPKRPSHDRWLRDPVWNVIVAGWHPDPEKRCELSVMHNVFLTSSQLVVRNAESSGLSAKHDRNPIKVPDMETQREQRGKVLPRIVSFFQSLRDSESGAQRRVDEIDRAGLSTLNLV